LKADRILRFLYSRDYYLERSGDLEEAYADLLEKSGSLKAKAWLWFQILKLLSGIIRINIVWGFIMFKNYLTVALRVMFRQKLYVAINVFGLAIGLACFILIMSYVQYESSYDTFHVNSNHIYRVAHRSSDVYMEKNEYAPSPAPLAQALLNEFPEVKYATALVLDNARLKFENKHFSEKGLLADGQFFRVFSFPTLLGDPKTSLTEKGSIVLTISLAQKIFGQADPLGQVIDVDGWTSGSYKVTGVIKDVPENSHFTFSFITSLVSEPQYRQSLETNNWSNANWHTYILLHDSADPTQLKTKMQDFETKYLAHQSTEHPKHFFLQPMTSIHLKSHLNNELSSNGDFNIIILLSSIAFLILLMACANYMNLAIARSIKRINEVGIRKVVGALPRQLILQFIGESMLLSLLSMVLAAGLIFAVWPGYRGFVGHDLNIAAVNSGWMFSKLLGLTMAVGFISGSYPAFFIASARPSWGLKKMPRGSSRLSRFQRVLVVSQYAAAIALIVGVIIIYQQLRYIRNKDLGYDRKQVLVIKADSAVEKKYEALKDELANQSSIFGVTSSSQLITDIPSGQHVSDWEGRTNEKPLRLYHLAVGYDFLDFFKIGLIEGRDFSPKFLADKKNAFLFNETAVRALGWKSGLGRTFRFGNRTGHVVGVMKDFHLHSLRLPIGPLFLELRPDWINYLYVRISSTNLGQTLALIKDKIKTFTPYPLEYNFLDEVFDRQYQAETKLNQIISIFALLALLIASLGLFGLAALTTEQRTKEIGVRLVIGASKFDVVLLLTKEFTKLVFVASVFALPLAYLIMTRWLGEFAYRIKAGPGAFAGAVSAVLIVAWLSVSYQAIRTSMSNPVDSLRHE
jgi:putative ABC transport system permease protein